MIRFDANPTAAAPNSVKVPVIVTSLLKARVAAAVSASVPPELIVTAPVKVFVPVALVILNVPLVPPPWS